jgi:hypothetical protein
MRHPAYELFFGKSNESSGMSGRDAVLEGDREAARAAYAANVEEPLYAEFFGDMERGDAEGRLERLEESSRQSGPEGEKAIGFLNSLFTAMNSGSSYGEYSDTSDTLRQSDRAMSQERIAHEDAMMPGDAGYVPSGSLTQSQDALRDQLGLNGTSETSETGTATKDSGRSRHPLQDEIDALRAEESGNAATDAYPSLNEIIMKAAKGDPEKELAQKKFNAWQALAMGGAAAMGSGDPNAFGAIGKGAQEGLGSFATAQNVDIAQRGKSLDRAIQLADVEARSREKSRPPTFLEWQKDTWPKLAKEMGFVMETMGKDSEALIELQKSIYEKSYGRMRRSNSVNTIASADGASIAKRRAMRNRSSVIEN